MRIALYGGSFNPPHVGHAMVAVWLSWTDQVDEVWFLPTFSHPFSKDLAPFADRVAMCRVVADLVGGAAVCTIEEELDTPSYTVDTLAALQLRHPGHRFRLVVGADVLEATDRWKDWDGIVARHAPILAGRQGWPTPDGAIDFPRVSSTEVRARVRAGAAVGHLVPHPILADVVRLYGAEP